VLIEIAIAETTKIVGIQNTIRVTIILKFKGFVKSCLFNLFYFDIIKVQKRFDIKKWYHIFFKKGPEREG
jgi:hypothetical protein